MLQDAFRIFLEDKMREEWTPDGQLFRRWCLENVDTFKDFRFFKSAAKEKIDGVEVPIWEEADVTLLSKLRKERKRSKEERKGKIEVRKE